MMPPEKIEALRVFEELGIEAPQTPVVNIHDRPKVERRNGRRFDGSNKADAEPS